MLILLISLHLENMDRGLIIFEIEHGRFDSTDLMLDSCILEICTIKTDSNNNNLLGVLVAIFSQKRFL